MDVVTYEHLMGVSFLNNGATISETQLYTSLIKWLLLDVIEKDVIQHDEGKELLFAQLHKWIAQHPPSLYALHTNAYPIKLFSLMLEKVPIIS